MKKNQLLIMLLSLVATGVLIAVFYAPIWWVSLTAPNYPPEAFPDGVRINFHMNGVFNGCELVKKAEIAEEHALDCVHEMDTINHYVGMYPIAAGGVVEKAFSPFLTALLGVMVLGFMCTRPKLRVALMSVGFGLIAIWMYLTFYTHDGLKYQSSGYLSALVNALDQGTEAERSEAVAMTGDAILARLKASMAQSTVTTGNDKAQKSVDIATLRQTFDNDQMQQPDPAKRRMWDGSGMQMLAWHYEKSQGRYFNNPHEIKPLVRIMSLAAHIVFWGILAAMILLIYGARKNRGVLYWLLIIVPLLLPVFFVIEYSAWLWWYGHNLNEMGAFTVKPFMPTVFGDGKVAQFTTHSYPYWGFGLMVLFSALLAAVALLRRAQGRDEATD